MVTLQLRQPDAPPGPRLLICNLDWKQFKRSLEEIGETCSCQIAYNHGGLKIMALNGTVKRLKIGIARLHRSAPDGYAYPC